MSSRNGYALVTVLWFLTAAVLLATAGMTSARAGLGTASNRAALLRAEWQAEECLARARAALQRELARVPETGGSEAVQPGLALRDRVLTSVLVRDCPGLVSVIPAVVGLDLSVVGADAFKRVLRACGVPESAADSLTNAFLDWRDPDDDAIEGGSERRWYEARGLPLPRNGPLVSVRELALVRGFDAWFPEGAAVPLTAHFTVEQGRIFLEAASPVVLSLLPGLDAEAVALLGSRRVRNDEPLRDLASLSATLSPESGQYLLSSIGALSAIATVVPDTWVLRAASSGVPGAPRDERLRVEIELLISIDGARVSINRRRLSA